MEIRKFLDIIGGDFFTGVPDSLLSPLCDCLYEKYGLDREHHIVGANEGNCVAMGAGYHLATGKVPIIYMQNSGLGNVINPITSLTNPAVYGIPMIFIIGWRGEPGTADEPQHIFQGQITLRLLEDTEINYVILETLTTEEQLMSKMEDFKYDLSHGKSVAFVVRKDALTNDKKGKYQNEYTLNREEVIRKITDYSENNPIISATGKISRELFEIREEKGQGHGLDFLTVGSMGHTSSIALSIALQKDKKVWCIDGDGGTLMHLGAMATIGAADNIDLVHIIINNCAHETVGGMPTVMGEIDVPNLAKSLGYDKCYSVDNERDLEEKLKEAKENKGKFLIEIKCALSSRKNLGRPTTTPKENKEAFMKEI